MFNFIKYYREKIFKNQLTDTLKIEMNNFQNKNDNEIEVIYFLSYLDDFLTLYI